MQKKYNDNAMPIEKLVRDIEVDRGKKAIRRVVLFKEIKAKHTGDPSHIISIR